MSSRTPTECIDLATDPVAPDDARTEAIQELRNANECDELARLARSEDLEDQFRRDALRGLANPQCDSMLSELSQDEGLGEDLRERATALLDGLDGR